MLLTQNFESNFILSNPKTRFLASDFMIPDEKASTNSCFVTDYQRGNEPSTNTLLILMTNYHEIRGKKWANVGLVHIG